MMKRRIWKLFRFTQRWRKTPLLLILLVIGVLVAGSGQITTGNEQSGRGGIEEGQPISEPGHYCNTIVPVFQHFGFTAQDVGNGLVEVTIPGSTTLSTPIAFTPYLEKLPSDPSTDLSYNAQTKQVCASEKNGKQALTKFLVNIITQAIGQTVNQMGNNLDPATWVTNAITGFWDKLWKQMAGFFQQLIDWANDFGFIWITPSGLSYKNPMVLAGAAWAAGALDSYIALLLVVGGYQMLLNRSLGLEDRSSALGAAMRVIFMAVIANTGFFLLLPSMVELANNLGMGIMGTLWTAAQARNVSLPPLGGAINWADQPLAWSIFILIYLFICLLLIAVEAVRLAVLDVAIMFSPLWIMALANEYSRAWGKFGALTFFSALFMQPIQVGCISLGAALIANFGHFNPDDPSLCQQMQGSAHTACLAHLGNASISGSMNPVVLVLGIATLYVAIKIPGMLFSNALRASVGSVNRDIAQMARTVMSFVFIQKELMK